MPTRKPAPKRQPAARVIKPAAKPARRAVGQAKSTAKPAGLPAKNRGKTAQKQVSTTRNKSVAKPAARVAPPKKSKTVSASPKPARAPGQPVHVPDEQSKARVIAWSGGGIEQDLISASLSISTPTLIKHYAPQLAIGKATMDGLAITTLAMAMRRGGKEAVTAAKWWTQSRMGWTERLIPDDGKPADTPMRVIIELVGEAPTVEHRPARTRPGFDPSLVQLVG